MDRIHPPRVSDEALDIPLVIIMTNDAWAYLGCTGILSFAQEGFLCDTGLCPHPSEVLHHVQGLDKSVQGVDEGDDF